MHIVLCDDHALVADGIAMLLRSFDPLLRISTFLDAASLLAAAPRWQDVELVLLDLTLPDASGMRTLLQLRSLREDVPVVVLSAQSDRTTVLKAIDAGAMGFIPKAATTQTMTQALRIVLAKGVFVPDSALDWMPSPEQLRDRLDLTAREWEVLHAVLKGQSVKQIARDLDIAPGTVKTHVSMILRALGVTTRTEAIVKAVQLGMDFSGGSRAG